MIVDKCKRCEYSYPECIDGRPVIRCYQRTIKLRELAMERYKNSELLEVRDVKKIKEICESGLCNADYMEKCPFWSMDGFCIVRRIPAEWDVELIEQKIKEYEEGKSEKF